MSRIRNSYKTFFQRRARRFSRFQKAVVTLIQIVNAYTAVHGDTAVGPGAADSISKRSFGIQPSLRHQKPFVSLTSHFNYPLRLCHSL